MQTIPRAIVLGGIIAGAGDILYAFIFYGLRGIPPLSILQSIASGLLGRASYAGGLATASLGALLHFSIAVAASATVYFASRKFEWLIRHAVVSGLVFGVCVWLFMNFVVVPLSAFPHKQAFPPLVVVTGLLAHMFLFGVPIALCARAGTLRARA